jgi:hypothetical protein
MTPERIQRPRVPRGARPVHLESGQAETQLVMLLALATEVSALADEVDDLRLELASARGVVAVPAEVEAARSARRRAMIDRLLRIVQEDLGSADHERRNSVYRDFVEQLSR